MSGIGWIVFSIVAFVVIVINNRFCSGAGWASFCVSVYRLKSDDSCMKNPLFVRNSSLLQIVRHPFYCRKSNGLITFSVPVSSLIIDLFLFFGLVSFGSYLGGLIMLLNIMQSLFGHGLDIAIQDFVSSDSANYSQ